MGACVSFLVVNDKVHTRTLLLKKIGSPGETKNVAGRNTFLNYFMLNNAA
jgi:hypothetical protein